MHSADATIVAVHDSGIKLRIFGAIRGVVDVINLPAGMRHRGIGTVIMREVNTTAAAGRCNRLGTGCNQVAMDRELSSCNLLFAFYANRWYTIFVAGRITWPALLCTCLSGGTWSSPIPSQYNLRNFVCACNSLRLISETSVQGCFAFAWEVIVIPVLTGSPPAVL